ncbi:MAG: protoheme IX farnesyltransferase [Burkholderiales bacterium]|nr:protoheme IX farnesyltransferase [Burkholderiales bacterium]
MKTFLNLFKLRIGIVIALTAVTGIAVTPGPRPTIWQSLVLALSVLVASAAAGAFNQYAERDLDARMRRTRARPFVSGSLRHGRHWLALIVLMIVAAVGSAALAVNPLAALYVFLGAFFYAVVYTVWLKRRTWLNIVIGGLAGSFAVLAGAASVSVELTAEALAFAFVLFLWTPPHFWSLAIAFQDDYRAAGVPMLPVLVGESRSARVIFWNSVLLVAASLLPAFYSLGAVYLVGAVAGGAYLLVKSVALVRAPNRATAMANFHATLVQLSLLLFAALIDAGVRD